MGRVTVVQRDDPSHGWRLGGQGDNLVHRTSVEGERVVQIHQERVWDTERVGIYYTDLIGVPSKNNMYSFQE